MVDATILNKMNVTDTKVGQTWTIHKLSVFEAEIALIASQLAPGPWYAHFWNDDSDSMIIVYKDKLFSITKSNPATWTEAIAYGKELNIPEEQFNFQFNV